MSSPTFRYSGDWEDKIPPVYKPFKHDFKITTVVNVNYTYTGVYLFLGEGYELLRRMKLFAMAQIHFHLAWQEIKAALTHHHPDSPILEVILGSTHDPSPLGVRIKSATNWDHIFPMINNARTVDEISEMMSPKNGHVYAFSYHHAMHGLVHCRLAPACHTADLTIERVNLFVGFMLAAVNKIDDPLVKGFKNRQMHLQEFVKAGLDLAIREDPLMLGSTPYASRDIHINTDIRTEY